MPRPGRPQPRPPSPPAPAATCPGLNRNPVGSPHEVPHAHPQSPEEKPWGGWTVQSLCDRGPPHPTHHTGLSLGEAPAPQACNRLAPSWGPLRTAGGRASRPPRAPPFFSGHQGWTDPALSPLIPRTEAPARGLSQAQGLDGAEPLPSGPLQSGGAYCNGGPEASVAQISSQSPGRGGGWGGGTLHAPLRPAEHCSPRCVVPRTDRVAPTVASRSLELG